MNSIKIKHIFKRFGDKQVLSDFSLLIEGGITTCIMGPSGCGKTTLLRIIGGLETADRGEIISNINKISFVFQEDRLSENYSAVSNIKFVVGKAVSRNEIEEMLGEFGLEVSINKPARELSGGMKRRVAIARALCAEYDLLIMDEPLKGLDDKLKKAVMNIIKQKTAGKTVIYVTHDKSEAEFFGDRLINMEMKI